MRLSVVIVSYNVRPYLVQCIESVRCAMEGIDGDIWVVDNASSDDSVDALRTLFPDVHLIVNKENVGFSKANNQAINQSTGDFVLLLNPDTIIGKRSLADALALMDREPKAGGVGVKMLNNDGSFARESRRGLPTPATAFYKMMGLCHIFPKNRRFGKYYMQYLNREEKAKIEVISGAFMMLRRAAIDQVGCLDEDYFMYGEDIDLSYRLLKGGWDNWYVPTPILHYKGESTKTNSTNYVFNFYNAMLIFFRKHFIQRYRWMAPFVKLAVLCYGATAMLMKWGRVLLYSMHACINSISRIVTNVGVQRERLLFIGSDEAWQPLHDLCERCNLEAFRCNSIDTAVKDARRLNALYLTIETDSHSDDYSTALEYLMKANEMQSGLHLGTYSLKHKTLLLPNDCFC